MRNLAVGKPYLHNNPALCLGLVWKLSAKRRNMTNQYFNLKMALKVGDIQLSKQHPSVRILIITKLLPAVASKQSWNCIAMLSMEEEKSFVYISPKRRCCFISSIILIFLVLFGIGILAGYFIGRGVAKSCNDGDKNDGCNPPKGHTQEQLEEFHKRAVDMISTEELKNNLK